MNRLSPLLAFVAVASLVFTACTGTSETTTTPVLVTPTTVSPEELSTGRFEADVELIRQLWHGQTTAWIAGFDAGIEFWVENNYPDMNCTYSDYMASRFPNGPIEGLVIERVPDLETVELDEGWVIPGGRLEGETARGRVYKVSVESIRYEPGRPTPTPEVLELHVTILDERPHFFLGCPS